MPLFEVAGPDVPHSGRKGREFNSRHPNSEVRGGRGVFSESGLGSPVSTTCAYGSATLVSAHGAEVSLHGSSGATNRLRDVVDSPAVPVQTDGRESSVWQGRCPIGKPEHCRDAVAACGAEAAVPTVTGFRVLRAQREGEALQAAPAAGAYGQGTLCGPLPVLRMVEVHVPVPACRTDWVPVLRRLDQVAKLLLAADEKVQAVHRKLQLVAMSGPQ